MSPAIVDDMANPRTTGKSAEKRRAIELESVAKFIAERCEASPSEFLTFREMLAAHRQFCTEIARQTYDDVETSLSLRPGWEEMTYTEKALLRADVRAAFDPVPEPIGPGLFSVALERLGYEPRRRRMPGYAQPVNVIAGLRLR